MHGDFMINIQNANLFIFHSALASENDYPSDDFYMFSLGHDRCDPLLLFIG